MNILFLILFSIFSFLHSSDINEMDKKVMHALKNGDAKILGSFFTSSIKLSIHNEEQIANKFQAELIVSDFLNNNKLLEIKKSTQQKDSQSSYLIYDVKTEKRQVRVFMKIVNFKNKDHIAEFRVE